MLGPNALIASGADAPTGPALTVNLPQSSAGDLAHYELVSHMQSKRFGRTAGWQTWEPSSFVVDLLTSERVGGRLTLRYENSWHAVYGIEHDDWFAAFEAEDGYWTLHVVASSDAVAGKIAQAVAGLAGDAKMPNPDEVSMSVWSEHPMGGGMARHSMMKVGTWGDVSANYPAATRAALESLAANLPEKGEGGLVVFCGPAGTGKTRAIEALAAAWAGSARLGVVVDSDRLLKSASYLADVLTAAGDTRQVIVAEDVDELVQVGPKSHETSKLLNIADGLVGRLAGAGTLFVLTANLPHEKIADYVVRPGRAAAVIEFEEFGVEEANEWLAGHGSEATVEEPTSLAKLYASLKG